MIDPSTLPSLPASVQRPAYDRSRVKAGIAHLSVGNFHRAHQAVYIDKVLALPQIGEITVNLVFDPPWDRSRMSEEAQLTLGL